jgi:hypothetical protein
MNKYFPKYFKNKQKRNNMKTFDGDFNFFLNKIINGEHYALSRWGDGELRILQNKFIDLRNKKNGEFRYDPRLKEYKEPKSKLEVSYTARDSGYYIGVACPCCRGQRQYKYMKRESKQDEAHLTWANIFVNSNYRRFVNDFIPEMQNHDVVMVVNHKADTSKLPFDVEKTYKVGTDAWKEDCGVIDRIKEDYHISKDKVFLFAAGPLANIITYELWFHMNKNNTYIDVGSTLDVQMGMTPTRGYQVGGAASNKVCVW